jgi:hypothetical protein
MGWPQNMLLTIVHGQAYRNITRNNITERPLYPSSQDGPNRYVRTSHGNLHPVPSYYKATIYEKHTYKTKDRVTGTPLKPEVNSGAPEG